LEKSIELRIEELEYLEEPFRSRTILTVRQDLDTLSAVSERAGEREVGPTSFLLLYRKLCEKQSLFNSEEVEVLG
jgi:hypothetical protein